MKEKMKDLALEDCCELIHFGITSMDINNTAIPLLVHEAMIKVYFFIYLKWSFLQNLALSLKKYSAYYTYSLQFIQTSLLLFPLQFIFIVSLPSQTILPNLRSVRTLLLNLTSFSPMLGRTHGQPAVPTVMGKEIMVFVERWSAQV